MPQLPGNHATTFFTVLALAAAPVALSSALEVVNNLFVRVIGLSFGFSLVRDHLPPLRRWHRGRVVLLGDAAHAMTPDLGQGACQALLDASVLAQELAATDDPTLAFAHYQARRHPGATQIQRASRTGGWVRQWHLAPLRWCRDLVIRLMPSQLLFRGLRRFISLS